MIAAPAGS